MTLHKLLLQVSSNWRSLNQNVARHLTVGIVHCFTVDQDRHVLVPRSILALPCHWLQVSLGCALLRHDGSLVGINDEGHVHGVVQWLLVWLLGVLALQRGLGMGGHRRFVDAVHLAGVHTYRGIGFCISGLLTLTAMDMERLMIEIGIQL